MNEHHFETVRTARYVTLGELGPETSEVWVVCHGYRQLACRFLRRFRSLDDGSRYIVAPEALSRFYVDPAPGRHGPEHRVGASWMTREDRQTEIDDYVRYLDGLTAQVMGQAPDARLFVLGFSQGVHTTARWVTYGQVQPHRLILWAAYLPPDLDMERAADALVGVRVSLVRGLTDQHASEELEAREGSRLDDSGIEHDVLTHEGGHRIDQDLLLDIAAAG